MATNKERVIKQGTTVGNQFDSAGELLGNRAEHMAQNYPFQRTRKIGLYPSCPSFVQSYSQRGLILRRFQPPYVSGQGRP